jgi:hypothetical protein
LAPLNTFQDFCWERLDFITHDGLKMESELLVSCIHYWRENEKKRMKKIQGQEQQFLASCLD